MTLAYISLNIIILYYLLQILIFSIENVGLKNKCRYTVEPRWL